MASKNIYIGDSNGIARETKKFLLGDGNGVARKIKKVLYGDENGVARIVYKKPIIGTILLDSANHYRSDIVNDFVTFSDYGAYFSFDSNDVLGVNATGGNSNYCAKTPLYKDSATKMYVELEVTYALSQRNVIIDIYKNIPTQTFGEVVWEWKQLDYPYTRGTYEISLANVPPNEPFYVGFHKADVNLKIYKIWFDGEIEF